MTAEMTPRNKKTSRGKVSFELQNDGKSVAVHVDRQGFRRLLETLEQLAATGERQTFDKSGRNRRKPEQGAGSDVAKLVFHIEADHS